MALETTAVSIVYTGNGSSSTPYPVPFAFLDVAHIRVVVTGADGVETTLSGGQFAVTRFDSGLGELVTTAAWDNTHALTVSRVSPTTQPIVLADGALIPAKTLERGLDRLAMISQETKDKVGQVAHHASTHAAGGTDPVTLAQSQITGLVSDLAAKAAGSALSAHLADTSNPHGVTKAQLGLGFAQNTADADKPVSTAQQAALDAKADKLVASRTETDSTVLVLADAGKVIGINSSGAASWTVPPHSDVPFPVGTVIAGAQYGAGTVTLVAGAGVNLKYFGGTFGTIDSAGLNATWAIWQQSADNWLVSGRLAS